MCKVKGMGLSEAVRLMVLAVYLLILVGIFSHASKEQLHCFCHSFVRVGNEPQNFLPPSLPASNASNYDSTRNMNTSKGSPDASSI